jgi:hypothetical protein
LFRLFLKNPKTAEKWLINLAEYHPGAVKAELSELGIKAQEYSLYSLLSHDCHSNLLASLSTVQERDLGKQGILRTFHFGSARTPEVEYFVQVHFLMMFFLLFISLKEPLAELYYRYSKSDIFIIWYNKIDGLRQKLIELNSEINKSIIRTSEVDQTFRH